MTINITEIKRRIAILEKKKPVDINKRMLRGGMNHRNRRQQVRDYNKEIIKKRQTYKDKLIELQKPSEETLFRISSATVSDDVLKIEEKFCEPKLKRSTRWGW